MMLTMDLPSMFGIMTRPANRLISVRDAEQFDDWLHVILNPVVVRVYAGGVRTRSAAFDTRSSRCCAGPTDSRSLPAVITTCYHVSRGTCM